jgi:alpha-beta hydrolase superfamily lysophospholipase
MRARLASIAALAALLAPASCASHAESVRAPAPRTVEGGVEHGEGRFEGAGGARLFEQHWRPAGADARGVLVLVHGLKDHSARYASAAETLARRGFAVYAFDLRGHGRSDGARVAIDAFAEYLDDLDRFLACVREREPARPTFLFGHSMGGAIVTLFAIERRPALAGIVLSAPALRVADDVPAVLVGSTKLLGAVLPGLPVFGLESAGFSRDPAVVRENDETDPLIEHGRAPARTASELLGAIAEIQERMEEVRAPLLILHGTADRITDPEGSRELAARARSGDVTLRLYDGLYHDLLHEPEQAEVLGEIAAWLEARAR